VTLPAPLLPLVGLSDLCTRLRNILLRLELRCVYRLSCFLLSTYCCLLSLSNAVLGLGLRYGNLLLRFFPRLRCGCIRLRNFFLRLRGDLLDLILRLRLCVSNGLSYPFLCLLVDRRDPLLGFPLLLLHPFLCLFQQADGLI
jgi:hypothetical protein